MNREVIDTELQLKVREYLKNVFEREANENLERVYNMVQKLSPSLREEVMMKTHGKILKKYPLFAKNFSKSFLKKLVFLLKKKSVLPEEFIFQVY
jgi:hypothetical protein